MTGSETSSAGPVVSPEQALEFVASASALLARSLDYETTLREVARLAVPDVADWCGVLLVDSATGSASSPAATTTRRSRPSLLEIRRQPARGQEGASESRRVAESGEPILATDVRAAIDETIEAIERELVERLAPKSYMIVPLAARGRVLGSMTLLSTRAGRHYAESDLAFAAALAAALRAGHRQRAPARPRRALAEPARHRVLHGAGGPGPRRSRPALRARQRDLRRLQRRARWTSSSGARSPELPARRTASRGDRRLRATGRSWPPARRVLDRELTTPRPRRRGCATGTRRSPR